MTDAVPDIEFLKRELEERDRTIDRLTRERKHADGDRHRHVDRCLAHRLPGLHVGMFIREQADERTQRGSDANPRCRETNHDK